MKILNINSFSDFRTFIFAFVMLLFLASPLIHTRTTEKFLDLNSGKVKKHETLLGFASTEIIDTRLSRLAKSYCGGDSDFDWLPISKVDYYLSGGKRFHNLQTGKITVTADNFAFVAENSKLTRNRMQQILKEFFEQLKTRDRFKVEKKLDELIALDELSKKAKENSNR